MDQLGVSLRCFAQTATLYIQRESTSVLTLFRQSLEDADPNSMNDASLGSLFPALKTVILDVFTSRLTESSWADIVKILKYRKADGRPLERLVLMGTHLCHLSPDCNPGVTKARLDISRVKAFVDEVVDLRGGERCTCEKDQASDDFQLRETSVDAL